MGIELRNHSLSCLTPWLHKRDLNTQVDISSLLEAWQSVVKCGYTTELHHQLRRGANVPMPRKAKITFGHVLECQKSPKGSDTEDQRKFWWLKG